MPTRLAAFDAFESVLRHLPDDTADRSQTLAYIRRWVVELDFLEPFRILFALGERKGETEKLPMELRQSACAIEPVWEVHLSRKARRGGGADDSVGDRDREKAPRARPHVARVVRRGELGDLVVRPSCSPTSQPSRRLKKSHTVSPRAIATPGPTNGRQAERTRKHHQTRAHGTQKIWSFTPAHSGTPSSHVWLFVSSCWSTIQ